MAIQFVSATSFPGTGAVQAVPLGYAVGDLILCWAFRTDGVDPGDAHGAGFEDIGGVGGTSNLRWRLGYKYARDTSTELIGTWNGSDVVVCDVYRDAAPVLVTRSPNGAASGILIYSALTPSSASSWLTGFVGTEFGDNTGAATPPNGFVNRTNRSAFSRRMSSHDTNGIAASYAGQNITKGGTNGGWRTLVYEILEKVDASLAKTEAADIVSASLAFHDVAATLAKTEAADVTTAMGEIGRALAASIAEADDIGAGAAELSRHGNLAATEAADTSSGQAFVGRIATLAATEAADVSSGQGYIQRNATAGLTEGTDASAGTLVDDRLVAIAATEEDDIGSGLILYTRNASLAKTEGADTTTSFAEIGRFLTGSIAEADDIGAGAMELSRYANLAVTEAADTSSAQGFVQRNATAGLTEGADVSSGTLVHNTNVTISMVEEDDAGAGAIQLSRHGNLAKTEAADVSLASGEIGRFLTASIPEEDDIGAGAIQLSRYATLAKTEAADTVTGQGYREINATLAATEAADAITAEGDLIAGASLAKTEAADTVTASGALTIGASLAKTEGADASIAQGYHQRNASLAKTEGADIVPEVYFDFIVTANLAVTEDPDKILTGFTPEEGRRPPQCVDIDSLVEAGLDRILTQYRESPNLLYFLRMGLKAGGQAWDTLCDMPEYFDIEYSTGDQLTLIGERMGFGRCHCLCAPRKIFGFKCANDQGIGDLYVGFCEDGEWAACAGGSLTDICINDDEVYRDFMMVRAYQIRALFDLASLKKSIEILRGPTARILSVDGGQVVVAPFRRLTDTEKGLIKLVPRVLPVAPGIRIRIHLDTYPNIIGFGEGWGGFCDEIPGEAIHTDENGDRYLETQTGREYLAEGEVDRNAYWMCPIDVKPYDC